MSKNVTKFWTESPLVYDSNRLYMGILRVYTEAYFCSDFFSLRFRNFRCPVLFILALCIRSLFSSWSVVWFFFARPNSFHCSECTGAVRSIFTQDARFFIIYRRFLPVFFRLSSSWMHFYVSGVNSDISFLLFGSLSLYGSSVVVRFKHSIGVVCASERLFLLSLLLSRFLSLSLRALSSIPVWLILVLAIRLTWRT